MSDRHMNLMKTLVKQAIWLCCGLALLGVSGCGMLTGPAQSKTQQAVVSIDQLKFQDAKTGERFRALNTCVDKMADSTWQSVSYQLSGNFYEARWCRGAGARSDCQIAEASMDQRDQQAIQMSTLFYPQSYPEVFGLSLNTLWVPQTTGWGASFSFAENGGSVVGDGWQVIFREYVSAGGDPASTIYLGDGYSYKIEETTVDQRADSSSREDLAQYMASPEAMRDRGLAQIGALAQKVKASVGGHHVSACDRGPYQGNGVQPECTPRPLTQAEETAELGKADAHFEGQEQLLRDHYQEMYAAWMKAFPLDQCWP